MAMKEGDRLEGSDVDSIPMIVGVHPTTGKLTTDDIPRTYKGEPTMGGTDVDLIPSPKLPEPLKGARLFITILGLALAVFCVALDDTIIATATPYITDQFKNLNDVGWYGSSYLLLNCAFQLLYGKLYKFFNIKGVFLTGLFIFEIGSLICAVSPNSTSLIAGSKSHAAV